MMCCCISIQNYQNITKLYFLSKYLYHLCNRYESMSTIHRFIDKKVEEDACSR